MLSTDRWRPMASTLRAEAPLGLVRGLGRPRPGQNCILAAKCRLLGEPHSDSPSCDAAVDQGMQTYLNDAPWTRRRVRAEALLPIAIASLGSAEDPDRRRAWSIAVLAGILRVYVSGRLRGIPSRGPHQQGAVDRVCAAFEAVPSLGGFYPAMTICRQENAALPFGVSRLLQDTRGALAGLQETTTADTLHCRVGELVSVALRDAAGQGHPRLRSPVVDAGMLQVRDIILDAYRAHPHPGMIPPEEWPVASGGSGGEA